MLKQLLLSFICLVLLPVLSIGQIVTPNEALNRPPKADAEFRAAWVATVANINWPSKPGLPIQQQQQEAIALLDFLKEHHFNAVVFQVRPQADALYESKLEPWSYFLTGKQGQAPTPFYDPLKFWIEAAHDRGLELHAWLNPYRAHHIDGKEVSDKSIVKTNPELVVKLKEGYYWMDPAQKATQDITTNVVMDIVKRYDVDGIHFDDYFYPYPSYNLDEDFPDSSSWAAYQKAGGNSTRADWRRQSVNTLIKRIYKEIKKEKPYVKFGVSPFGIWRPGYPASIEGFDQFDRLYADAKLWLNKGWLDYFTPQLYWPTTRLLQSFPVLLGWWNTENTLKRHLWPGIAIGRDTGIATVNETVSQIQITRGMMPESKGTVHWSISSDINNQNIATALLNGVYKKQALVPPSKWLDDKAPVAPDVKTNTQGDSLLINWQPIDKKDAFEYVLYYQYDDKWDYIVMNRNDLSWHLKNFVIAQDSSVKILKKVAVTTVDRTGNESILKEIILDK